MSEYPERIDGADQVADYYQDKTVVDEYITKRFTNLCNMVIHKEEVAALNVTIARVAPERILEIAPGPVRVTRFLRGKGRITAIDSSEQMLRAASAAMRPQTNWRGECEFVRGDAFALPFNEATFQLVFALRFFQHFHSGERSALYAGVRRVLEPGGVFVFNAINASVHRMVRARDPQSFFIYDKLYELDELQREVNNAGFKIIKIHRQLCHPRTQWIIERVGRRSSKRLARVLINCLELLPSANPSEWMIECMKV